MRCRICGDNHSNMICPRCGYDKSQNREQYPTLADDGKALCANGALQDALFTSLTAQIAAMKLAGNPAAQAPTKRQTVQPTEQQQAAQIGHAAKALVASGTCGDQLTWELDADWTLTISGSGQMYDLRIMKNSKIPWKKYAKKITALSLPSGLCNIKDCAFSNCKKLKDVTIPDGVTSIGLDAFSECSALTSITHPDSVTSIGDNAFYSCSALTSITISNSVTVIGSDAFSDCSSLESVTLPNSVKIIQWYTFAGCDSLTSVIIPDSVTRIYDCAFFGCTALGRVRIPKSVEFIGNQVFENCPLVEIWGEASSAAESFARKNRIPFRNLNAEQPKRP